MTTSKAVWSLVSEPVPPPILLSNEWEKHSFGGIESRSMSTDEQRSQFAIYLTTVSTAWLDDLEVTVV